MKKVTFQKHSRSNYLQMYFKIGILQSFAYSEENTCVRVSV